MSRRTTLIFWPLIGIGACGVLAGWLTIHFGLLPVRESIWMDLYTGRLVKRVSCLGLVIRNTPAGNVTSGLVPGGNLASFEDPLGRFEWILVGYDDSSEEQEAGVRRSIYESGPGSGCYFEMLEVAGEISSNPRAGWRYEPPNGYTKNAKRQLLLNCLEVARESRDAEQIRAYYEYVVASLSELDHKALPSDLPDVQTYLALKEQTPASPGG